MIGSHRIKRGLTLLELLLVVFLLAAVAASAVSLADNADVQARHEVTKSRRDQIREAIFRRTHTPDGRVVLSGFAVDMGRLPTSLRELMQPVDDAGFHLARWRVDEVVDDDDGNDEVEDSFGIGWRGPYLSPDLEYSDVFNGHLPVFRDGWATVGPTDDPLNFGWQVVDATSPFAPTGMNVGDLDIRSFGRDGMMGAADPADPYALDFPTYPDPPANVRSVLLLREGDWQVDLRKFGSIAVVFSWTNAAPPTKDLCLGVLVPSRRGTRWAHEPDDPGPPLEDDQPDWSTGVTYFSEPITVTFSTSPQKEFFSFSSPNPIWVAGGARALIVVDATNGSIVGTGPPYPINLVPKTPPGVDTIPWDADPPP